MATKRQMDIAQQQYARSGVNRDFRITSCKLCPYGIFQGQPKVWMCNGYIGFVHERCLNGQTTKPV